MVEIVREWYHRHLTNPQVVILALLLLFGFLAVYFFGRVLTPLLVSLVIAYLLEGIVAYLQRLGAPRLPAVVIVFFAFLTVLVLVLLGLIPMLTRQVIQLVRELPGMISQGQQMLLELPERYPQIVSEEFVREIISTIRSQVTPLGQRVMTTSIAYMFHLVSLLVYTIIVPLSVFFLLKDKDVILNWFLRFMPQERALANEVWEQVNYKIGRYVRGKCAEIIIVWSVTFVVFTMFGMNYAMLLSFGVGLSVIVPYIGAAVLTIPIALVAYFQWGWGSEFVYVLIAYGVIQFLDGNLLATLLFSEVVNMHPIAVIAAIFVFGGYWGLWGVFFAIPLATLVQAVIESWPRQQPQPALPDNPKE